MSCQRVRSTVSKGSSQASSKVPSREPSDPPVESAPLDSFEQADDSETNSPSKGAIQGCLMRSPRNRLLLLWHRGLCVRARRVNVRGGRRTSAHFLRGERLDVIGERAPHAWIEQRARGHVEEAPHHLMTARIAAKARFESRQGQIDVPSIEQREQLRSAETVLVFRERQALIAAKCAAHVATIAGQPARELITAERRIVGEQLCSSTSERRALDGARASEARHDLEQRLLDRNVVRRLRRPDRAATHSRKVGPSSCCRGRAKPSTTPCSRSKASSSSRS